MWDTALKGISEGKLIMRIDCFLSGLFFALFSIGKLPGLDYSCQKSTMTLDHILFYLVP